MGLLGLVLAAVCAVGALLAAVQARHQAQAAADLGALAGAGDIGIAPERACVDAATYAVDNRAALTRCSLQLDRDGRSGEVRVSAAVTLHAFGLAWRATARARAARVAVAPAADPVATAAGADATVVSRAGGHWPTWMPSPLRPTRPCGSMIGAARPPASSEPRARYPDRRRRICLGGRPWT